MKKSRFSETQIVSILKQADAGMPVKDIAVRAMMSENGEQSSLRVCSS